MNKVENYEIENVELIDEATKMSNGDTLKALRYIVREKARQGDNIEFTLVLTIPSHTSISIFLPINYSPFGLGMYVDWGDGHITINECNHTYNTGYKDTEYQITFFGLDIYGFGMKISNDAFNRYLTKVVSFGNLGHNFKSLQYAFSYCQNNFTIPKVLPPSVTDISCMFEGCINFNQDVSGWDVSNITDMGSLFNSCKSFNQPLNTWKITPKLVSMDLMFRDCTNFNQPLNNWDTSNVKHKWGMFSGCTSLHSEKCKF